MKNFFAYLKRNLSPFFIASLSVLAFTVLVIRICIVNEGFADLINSTLAHYYRRILAAVTDFLPFSLFEVILALIPFILAALVFFAVRAYKASRGLKFLFILLGIISLLYSGYLWGLSMPYHTTAVEEKMELHPGEVSEEQIYSLIVKIADEVNLYSENVDFDSTLKETVMPYSFDDLAEKLNASYTSFDEKHPDILKNYKSNPKEMFFGSVMSDLHLSGVYSFFTGEANVSTDYPDYNTPFTAAHEMAHQRGILRENEANFVAFLVCLESDDAYIRYSAYLNMFEYLGSALAKTSQSLYKAVRSTLNDRAIADMKASSAVYKKHKDSTLGKLMEGFNDSYIKQNGQAGTVSYGLVVMLAVAYYENNNE